MQCPQPVWRLRVQSSQAQRQMLVCPTLESKSVAPSPSSNKCLTPGYLLVKQNSFHDSSINSPVTTSKLMSQAPLRAGLFQSLMSDKALRLQEQIARMVHSSLPADWMQTGVLSSGLRRCLTSSCDMQAGPENRVWRSSVG